MRLPLVSRGSMSSKRVPLAQSARLLVEPTPSVPPQPAAPAAAATARRRRRGRRWSSGCDGNIAFDVCATTFRGAGGNGENQITCDVWWTRAGNLIILALRSGSCWRNRGWWYCWGICHGRIVGWVCSESFCGIGGFMIMESCRDTLVFESTAETLSWNVTTWKLGRIWKTVFFIGAVLHFASNDRLCISIFLDGKRWQFVIFLVDFDDFRGTSLWLTIQILIYF